VIEIIFLIRYNSTMKIKKKIYFIGIEGGGTSALAQIYQKLGYEVLGSDNGDHFFGSVLAKAGIKVFPDFKAENLPNNIDFVVHSTAFKDDNPEMQEVKKRQGEFRRKRGWPGPKLKTLSYPEALANLFNEKFGIAVTGTHGKTSITAMAGELLESAKLKPTALVGSEVINWKCNTIIDDSKYFVLEADEYQNKLQHYSPKIVILNNIDFDHPDFFPTIKEYKQAFKNFVKKLDENAIVIANFDDKQVREVVSGIKAKVISFGKNNADFSVQLSDDNTKDFSKFYVFYKQENLGEFKLKVLGEHNIMNSLSVIALGHALGIKTDIIKKSLEEFSGTKRRLEYKGKYKGAIIYDDFAHHPTEVTASLKALRKRYPKNNIYCIFHPHSYTRTEALLNDFAESLKLADKVIVLDIYGSARENKGNVHSKDLVKLLGDKGLYIPTIEKCVDYLKPILKENDLAITMGAGDVWRVGEELL
jgi:UDP-N-acetylmuramate--alanine ligase